MVKLTGSAMGTSWSVTYLAGDSGLPEPDAVRAAVAAELERVEQSMSTWRDSSEISAFNRAPVGEWFSASPDFLAVLEAALTVGGASGGAYDVTVGPLVDLWGFGPSRAPVLAAEPPSSAAIAALLPAVGQAAIELDRDLGRVRKHSPRSLDLSSIAKGYGVDRVAELLVRQRIDDFLVEVGGELRASGHSPRGDAWRIAVEQPDAPPGVVAGAMALHEGAVATSGDYRNFFEWEGRRYSHSIDPRSGYPVEHELVSVTVVHQSATLADAWATALTVLGPEQGALVARQSDLAVYFIRRDGDGFSSSHTRAFEPYLATGAAQ